MGWLFKNLLRLLVVGAIAFAVYAFFAELPPPTERITVALEPPQPRSGGGTQDSAQAQPESESQAGAEGPSEGEGQAAEPAEGDGN